MAAVVQEGAAAGDGQLVESMQQTRAWWRLPDTYRYSVCLNLCLLDNHSPSVAGPVLVLVLTAATICIDDAIVCKLSLGHAPTFGRMV